MEKQIIGNATLYCGDALEILPGLESGFDALITDPPYSSGGLHMGQRAAAPSAKYIGNGRYSDFSGDARDARSWAYWSTLWLLRAVDLVKIGGYVMTFTDWRQLPASTDVLQAAGAQWRGVIAWDKTSSSRAPHRGYFRHQCEYVVWGSKGALQKTEHDGPYPGCVTVRVNPQEKLHMTGKPVELMTQLCRPVPDGGSVLDPFMGSASTALPILRRGGSFTGIEKNREIFDVACARIEQSQRLQAG